MFHCIGPNLVPIVSLAVLLIDCECVCGWVYMSMPVCISMSVCVRLKINVNFRASFHHGATCKNDKNSQKNYQAKVVFSRFFIN